MHTVQLDLNLKNACVYNCDYHCENQPCLHLVVTRETDVYKNLLKLLAFPCAGPLLFSRTGLGNLANTILPCTSFAVTHNLLNYYNGHAHQLSYTYKFSRDINFAVFTGDLSSMKFKSLKFYKTVVIHLKHEV